MHGCAPAQNLLKMGVPITEECITEYISIINDLFNDLGFRQLYSCATSILGYLLLIGLFIRSAPVCWLQVIAAALLMSILLYMCDYMLCYP